MDLNLLMEMNGEQDIAIVLKRSTVPLLCSA
jgi:hypothetical protein